MKHIIIIGDGMADHRIESLGNKTLLEYAKPEYMNMLAKNGRTGILKTIPEGFPPGSEVANTSILGYDLNKVYEGRGPLEAASIGYEMQPEDMVMRCNLITVGNGLIKNHHGGHITNDEGGALITYLNERLGNDKIKFIRGTRYRHLLIIKGGNKNITCAPPHDYQNQKWEELIVKGKWEHHVEKGRKTSQETADIINNLIHRSQELLKEHPLNIARQNIGKHPANSIWPWGGGYKPDMPSLMKMYPQIKRGSVISAVDLIRGIGKYAGLKCISVDGITGLSNTNYENKASAAINALHKDDFVFLHIEASDEAGHDGNIELKLKTIENLDKRIIKPIYEEIKYWSDPVCMTILPDHPTPVELRTHTNEPVPFIIWHNGIQPDNNQKYDEYCCANGFYGIMKSEELMKELMNIK